MSTQPIIQLDTGSTESKILGLSGSTWIKLIGLILVIIIGLSIWKSFTGWGNSDAFKNISESFTTATAGLAWATSHWYLFLAAFLISPFLSPASKWIADKVSSAKKEVDAKKLDPALSEKTLDAVASAAVSEQKADLAAKAEQGSVEQKQLTADSQAQADRSEQLNEDPAVKENSIPIENSVGITPIEATRMRLGMIKSTWV